MCWSCWYKSIVKKQSNWVHKNWWLVHSFMSCLLWNLQILLWFLSFWLIKRTFFGLNSYLTERKWPRSWPLLQHCCWLQPLHCSGFPVPDWKWAPSRWSHRLTGLCDSDSHYPDTRSVKRRWGRDRMTVIAWGTHSATQEALLALQRYNLHFNWSTHDLEHPRGLRPSFFLPCTPELLHCLPVLGAVSKQQG